MTMYAKWFYGFSPEDRPIITFSQKGNRDALLRKAKAGEIMVFVATKGGNTADADKGRVLGAAEIGSMAVRTEDVVEVFNLPETDFKDGKYRWPEAIPMLKAWRFEPPPLASEVFENGNLPYSAQTQAVALSDADETTIQSLNWIEVSLPETMERQRQQRLSDAFMGRPTKPGPVPTSGTRTFSVTEKDHAWTYAARFGDSNIWKIGRTTDLRQRLNDLNAHVPFEHLEQQWSIKFTQKWPSAERAQEMEQRVLAILDYRRTHGERVDCGITELENAWIKAITKP